MDNLQGRIIVVDSPTETVIGTVIRQDVNMLLLSSNVLPDYYYISTRDIVYQDIESGYIECTSIYQFGKEG